MWKLEGRLEAGSPSRPDADRSSGARPEFVVSRSLEEFGDAFDWPPSEDSRAARHGVDVVDEAPPPPVSLCPSTAGVAPPAPRMDVVVYSLEAGPSPRPEEFPVSVLQVSFSCRLVLVCSASVLASSVLSPIDTLDSLPELVPDIRCDEQVASQDPCAAVADSDVGVFEVGSEFSSEELVAATQASSSLVGCTWSF